MLQRVPYVDGRDGHTWAYGMKRYVMKNYMEVNSTPA